MTNVLDANFTEVDMTFYLNEETGALLLHLNGGEVKDDQLKELEADVTDAAKEKHVPVVERDGNKISVQVGSVEHPMEEKHFIQDIVVVQGDRVQCAKLHPQEAPKAEFEIEDGAATVYEYCNLHGLWKKEI